MKLKVRQQHSALHWLLRTLCSGAFLIMSLVIAVRAQDSSAALSKNDVLKLLHSGISSKRVATLAQEHKIDFPIDAQTAVQLREAGATDSLITTLRAMAPAPAATVLAIRSQPGGAQVYIDDELIGTTSAEGRLKLSTLAAGEHRVRVSAPGYQDYDHEIDVTRGELTEVEATLQSKSSVSQSDAAVIDNSQPAQPAPTPQPTVQASQATVYFFRPNNFNGNLIAPTLFCDGISLGKLPNAHYFSLSFAAGKHIFTSTNKKSRVELDLQGGNSYYIMLYMVAGLPIKGALSLVPNDSAAPQISGLFPCGTNTDIDGRIVSGCGH